MIFWWVTANVGFTAADVGDIDVGLIRDEIVTSINILANICVGVSTILIENQLLTQVKMVVAPFSMWLVKDTIGKTFEHKASGGKIVVFLYVLEFKIYNAEVK